MQISIFNNNIKIAREIFQSHHPTLISKVLSISGIKVKIRYLIIYAENFFCFSNIYLNPSLLC